MDELLAMQQKGYTMRIWRYLTFIFAITTRYTRPIFLTLFLLFGLPGSVYADLLTSLDEVLEKAQRGDAKAQDELGYLYDKTFYEILEKAQRGDAKAQENLGYLYAIGRGVPKNYAEAVKWYRLAAEQGYAKGQLRLGVMYDNGGGVPEDDTEAVKWYRLAAEQGYARAQFNLGNMYAKGEGVPEDDTEAVKWYRLATEQGYASAQFRLGNMYDVGEGVPENDIKAYAWYSLAKAQGDEDAEKKIEKLKKILTREQIAQAQALADELYTDRSEFDLRSAIARKNIPYLSIAISQIGAALLAYVLFFLIARQKNPFKKPVEPGKRPKWLLGFGAGLCLLTVIWMPVTGVLGEDIAGRIVLKTVMFCFYMLFVFSFYFIYKIKIKRKLDKN